MSKSNRSTVIFATVLFALMAFLFPLRSAEAQIVLVPSSVPNTVAPDGTICPDYPGITTRVVFCVQDTLMWAVSNFITPFSVYLRRTVGALCTLAIVLWGAMAAKGHMTAIRKDLIPLCIKLGAVVLFTSSFGGLFPVIINVLDGLLQLGDSFTKSALDDYCGPADVVWERVDCMIAYILGGFGAGVVLVSGLLGFVLASLFSGAIGFAIFLMGVTFLMAILTAIGQAIYSYIMAMVGIAVMVCVSPIFVPLILFSATRGYFEKWVRLFIGFILQPVILFIYLGVLLIAFDVVVFSGPNSLLYAIAGPASSGPGFLIGDWLLSKGVYVEKAQKDLVINQNPEELAAGIEGGKGSFEETGAMGVIGNWAMDSVKWDQNRVISSLIPNGSKNFELSLPVQIVDYCRLAYVRGFIPAGQVNKCEVQWQAPVYSMAINIVLSLFMAMLVAYIFVSILKYIPFMGASMAGEFAAAPSQALSMLTGGGMKAGGGDVSSFVTKNLGVKK
jgi:hypothetical protein